ncbi:MAG: hypothetical protein WAL61_05990 [Acidimicrobiales bacterium]
MPRRNLVPLVLLAVLGVGALGFAVLGASSAPSGATLQVQNGSTRTFGTPTGSTSFAMDLVNTISAGGSKSGTISQVRQVVYKPPNRMSVYQVVGNNSKLIQVANPSTIPCTLSAYTAIVGGSTPWTPSGKAFVRTETLAAYDARVPVSTATTCSPRASTVQGTVKERAAVADGYLLGVRLTVVVPPQKMADGQPATAGVENQALVLLEIDGTPTSTLHS